MRSLNRLANEAAGRLSHPSVEAEHYVLAMLHPDADGKATRALRACGLAYDDLADVVAARLRSQFEAEGVEAPPLGRGRVVSACAMELLARADGIAVGLGHAETRPEDLLLAVLWGRSDSGVVAALAGFGASRECIRDELALLGAAMPSVDLPPVIRWSDWRSVSQQELDEIRRSDIAYRIAPRDDATLVSTREPGDPVE
ncbi:MAG: Clp protease N-terminal domain-containing protein [Solirubrobacteraceae bacterium]